MTIETKYNLGDLVRYKEVKDDTSLYNTLVYSTKEGKIIAVGFLHNGGNNIYIIYTVVNPTNPQDTQVIFEQQIIERI